MCLAQAPPGEPTAKLGMLGFYILITTRYNLTVNETYTFKGLLLNTVLSNSVFLCGSCGTILEASNQCSSRLSAMFSR